MNDMTKILERLEKIENEFELFKLASISLESLPDGFVTTPTPGVSGGIKHINCDNNHLILNYPSPTAPTHLANKQYVDDSTGNDVNKFQADILIDSELGSYLIFDSTTSDFNTFNFQLVYWYPTGNLFILNTDSVSLNAQFNFNSELNISSLNTVPTDDSASQAGLLIQSGSSRFLTINGNTSAATTLNTRDAVNTIDINIADISTEVNVSASISLKTHTTVAHTDLPNDHVLGIHIDGEIKSSLFNVENLYKDKKFNFGGIHD